MKIVQSEFDRGALASKSDIAAGRPRLYWQTRGRWGEYLTQLMAERFGVVVEHTSDLTNAAKLSFEAGYNQTTRLHIDGQFGHGQYDAAVQEVNQFRMDYYRQLGFG